MYILLMILKKLLVSSSWFSGDNDSFTNCYLIGSRRTREVFVIDPGGSPDIIINKIYELECIPVAIILTHTHIDHRDALDELKKEFNPPIFYNKNEMECFRKLKKMKADKWIGENDILTIDQINLHVLETGGHSPGSLSLYSYNIKKYKRKNYEGIIFTGDLILKNSIGRTDIRGGDYELLCSNIKNKIMYNPRLSDKFLILAGHREITTIKAEKKHNPFKKVFL